MEPVLIVAPLRVARSVWPQEPRQWAHLSHIRVTPILGTPEQRRAACAQPGRYFSINFENLPWLVTHFGRAWPFRTVVVDEASKLRGYRPRQGGQRTRALAAVAHTRVRRFIELTGTPTGSGGLLDLWGQVWFLDQGQRLGKSFSQYTARWFQAVQVGPERHMVRYDAYPHTQAVVEQRLADLALALRAEDYFDLEAPIVTRIAVALPPAARAAYQAMAEELYVEIQGRPIEAFSAAAKSGKLLQCAAGAFYTNGGDFVVVHDAKLDALEEVIEEAAGMPVLVAYYFKSDLARIQQRFPKARVLDKNPQTIDDFNAGRIPILLAHPASAGHGLNLQHGTNILVFFSHGWSLEEYQQLVERIGPVRQRQAGYCRPVLHYHIVAENTLDDAVIARRETKRSIQDALMEALSQ